MKASEIEARRREVEALSNDDFEYEPYITIVRPELVGPSQKRFGEFTLRDDPRVYKVKWMRDQNKAFKKFQMETVKELQKIENEAENAIAASAYMEEQVRRSVDEATWAALEEADGDPTAAVYFLMAESISYDEDNQFYLDWDKLKKSLAASR